MISFVVPAHNEQSYLSRTLQAIHESARVVGIAYDIIVVDDASTDATAAVGQAHGATVVSVNHRQIAATRNSGARAAAGGRLFFVDADTTINSRVLVAALRALDNGAAGGGATARFEPPVPLYAPLLLLWLNFFMRLAGITGGACMFCTREAFQAVGGFNEQLYGAEDAAMSLALKRAGRFVVLWPRVITSGRRVRGMGGLQMLAILFRMAFLPGMLKRRSSVETVWYDSNRDENSSRGDSFAVRLSNAIMLILVIAFITGPLWGFISWKHTPLGTPLGEIRYAIAIFGCHVGLVLWPCAYFLLRSLLRQTRWIEILKLASLIALCLWFGWSGTREVISFWRWVYDWSINS